MDMKNKHNSQESLSIKIPETGIVKEQSVDIDKEVISSFTPKVTGSQ